MNTNIIIWVLLAWVLFGIIAWAIVAGGDSKKKAKKK